MLGSARVSLTGVKIWEAALTAQEIRAERIAGYRAIRQANLYANAPLASEFDLEDASGNGHHLQVDPVLFGELESTDGPINHLHANGAGSSGIIDIVTNASNCTWAASTSDATWAALSAVSGSGSTTMNYSASANASGQSRVATLTVAAQPFTLVQDASCTYLVSPSSVMSSAAGRTDYIAVTPMHPSCTWTTSSSQPWVTFADPYDSSSWQFYVGRILAESPVAYYDFQHAEGLVVPGVFVGPSATLQPGATVPEPGRLVLDGIRGRMLVSPSPTLTLTSGFNVSMWLESTGETGQIIGSVNGAWSLNLVTGGFLEVRLLGTTIRSTRPIADGWERFLSVAWNGSVVRIDLDGEPIGSGPAPGTLASSTSGLSVGASVTGNDYFAGALSEIVVLPYGYTAQQSSGDPSGTTPRAQARASSRTRSTPMPPARRGRRSWPSRARRSP